MPKYRATVRISGLEASDPKVVERAVSECLREAGFERWRLLGIEEEGVPVRPNPRPPGGLPVVAVRPGDARGVFLVTLAAFAVWFFLLLGP